MGFTVMLTIAMVVIAGMAVREVGQYRRKRAEYTLRRLTLRLSMAIMLLFLLASVLIGVRVFHLDSYRGVVVLWIAFWGCIMMLTGAILCLAIADLRSISVETSSETDRIWRDIATTIAEHEVHRDARETPPAVVADHEPQRRESEQHTTPDEPSGRG